MGLPPFKNDPFTNFTVEANAKAQRDALARVRSEWIGKDWPMYINGQEVTTGTFVERYNPGKNDELIGRMHMGGKDHASQAVETAAEAFESWRKVPAAARARYLLRASAVIKRKRFEFCAFEMLESGKNWAEADGDIAEAIDFLEFYARSMMEIDRPHPTSHSAGEENNVYWIPMGVGLCIPPWNFPLAITVGMTVAMLVAGNTVVLKPNPKSPIMSALFVEIMRELELPAGVLNMVMGDHNEIGDYLVEHPKVRMVSFTGSRAVGCHIYERAAKISPGQKWLKRVVAEMGGKDAILVDDSADLEAAADGIVAAAFGFQGQKCSACSRVIAHEAVHDQLLDLVVERTKRLKIGPAWEPSSNVACVVDDTSFEKVMSYVAIGKEEGTLVTGGEPAAVQDLKGYYIQPTIFKDIKPEHRLHQEEIFGPVLAFLKCKDFEDGLKIVNSTEYALTGGVFTQSREKLELAREEFHVGNLYLNRKCTGALVDTQPFGGFNMSGTDDKAGGREHLYRFLQAKTVCERL